jgi:exonuclease VII large subunit
LDQLGGLLESYSPENTLSRGFVLVRDGAEVITSPDQATPGRKVELQFAGGRRRRAVIDGGAAIRKPAKSAPSSGNQGSLL